MKTQFVGQFACRRDGIASNSVPIWHELRAGSGGLVVAMARKTSMTGWSLLSFGHLWLLFWPGSQSHNCRFPFPPGPQSHSGGLKRCLWGGAFWHKFWTQLALCQTICPPFWSMGRNSDIKVISTPEFISMVQTYV